MTSGLMLGLLAETHVHPGSGQTDGAIDLRVARESITGYPFVPGSAMKGALKTHYEDKNAFLEEEDRLNVSKIFGKADDAGHVLVSDARLVLLPVRSLSMAYVWLTCPLILERLCRDWRRLGLDEATDLERAISGMPLPGPEQMLCTGIDAKQRVFLEERLVEVCGDIDTDIVQAVGSLIPDGRARDRLPGQLGVVADATFGWFARNALPVQARNKLLPSTKASDALWYEESLAPDTLMAVTLSPRGGTHGGFSDLEAKLPDLKYLQVGGNETVGQGWMAVTTCDPSAISGKAGAPKEAGP